LTNLVRDTWHSAGAVADQVPTMNHKPFCPFRAERHFGKEENMVQVRTRNEVRWAVLQLLSSGGHFHPTSRLLWSFLLASRIKNKTKQGKGEKRGRGGQPFIKERGAEGKGVTWNTPTKAPSCIFSVAP
jgi:hypothetical protein